MGMKDSPFYWESVTQQRRDGIRKLKVGMTREEVERILPNPFLVEATGDGRVYLLYVTSEPRGEVTSNNLTPIAIDDGKVVGWGRNYFVNKEEYKIEIKK
jgi:outer membrane protein assembly factor BamE (lipoprotein component of BamABCDE complex)